MKPNSQSKTPRPDASPSNRQRSDEGDARRKLIIEADPVLRGDVDERLIRVRRGRDGGVHVFGYDRRDEES